jgi:hypothetical protein
MSFSVSFVSLRVNFFVYLSVCLHKTKFLLEYVKGRDFIEDVSVDGIIILK